MVQQAEGFRGSKCGAGCYCRPVLMLGAGGFELSISFEALGTSERFFNVFKMVSPPSPFAAQPLYGPGAGAFAARAAIVITNNDKNFRSFIECPPSVVFGRRHIFRGEHTTTAILSMRNCVVVRKIEHGDHAIVYRFTRAAAVACGLVTFERGECAGRAALRNTTAHGTD
jgi:hypothetical protein